MDNSLPPWSSNLPNPGLAAELLQMPPRPLDHIDAELLFVGDQILFHQKIDGVRRGPYFVSPSAVKAALLNDRGDSGWLDPSIVRHGDDGMFWAFQFFAPHKKQIQVEIQTPALKELEPEVPGSLNLEPKQLEQQHINVTLSVRLPGLVSFARGNKLYLWAVKGKVFDPHAELFKVPIPNVKDTGLVCMGAAGTPTITMKNLDAVWKSWWSNLFNKDFTDGKCKSHPKDVRLLLVELHHSEKPFPSGELQKIHYTTTTPHDLCQRLISAT